MNTNSKFLNKITELQNTYYAQNRKNILFKEKQKQECAVDLLKQVNLQDILNHTIFVIPNSCKIFIDYKIFKTFVEPSIYNDVLTRMLELTTYCIANYNTYEVHIDLSAFTITAAQRYKNLIQLYNTNCLKSDTKFSSILNSMHIYNPPSVIDNIATFLGPFIDSTVKSKILLHNKIESPALLANLLRT